MAKKGSYTKKLHIRNNALHLCISWISILIIIALVVAGTGALSFRSSGKKTDGQLPMIFGYGLANVLTGSMEPTFSQGTLLLVKQTEDVQTGDIVVYESGSSLVVHRVISINGDTVITQGDANNVPDEPFDRSQIRGLVIETIPFLGMASEILQSPAVTIFLLLCIGLLVKKSFWQKREDDEEEMEYVREEIQRLRKEIKEDEKKKKTQQPVSMDDSLCNMYDITCKPDDRKYTGEIPVGK